ncbi:MAG: EamA family transporter [Proteobacteria bacterium]|nr:EamA family transporter [Pseudomonadota bacterium]
MERGLLMAFTAVMFWGLLDASSRYAVVAMNADPMVFSCLNLMFGAIVLLAIAGPGVGGLETMRRGHTWMFGFFRVLMTLFLVFAFTALSASEVNFMLRVNVLLGLVAAWLLFDRKPAVTDIPGIALLTGGFITLVARQDDGFLNWAVGLVVLAAVCDTILTVIAERHPVSKKATGLKARCRYTGFVLFVTSLFFMLVAFLIAMAKIWLGDDIGHLPMAVQEVLMRAPTLGHFTHHGTLISAFVIGVVLRAPSMYLYLYAARLLKSENLMMAATLAPFATLSAESFFVAMGWLEAATLDMWDVFSGICMTTGALSMVVLRAAAKRRDESSTL